VSSFRGSLYSVYLQSQNGVQRALGVACPICRELPGTACKIEAGKPVVHAARESLAYNGKKLWT